MNMPKFSVVTVTRNDRRGLVITANSILDQQNGDFEWIVIDGGSGDGTVEYLKKLSISNLKWTSEKDDGIYDAMNKGMRFSLGQYIIFLNAGDIFPDARTLADVELELSLLGDPDILFGGMNFAFGNGYLVYRQPRRIERSIWHGLPANHQATYYRRGVLEGLLYDTQYRVCGDYYIVARLFKKGIRAGYTNRVLVRFAVGGESYRNRARLFFEPWRIQRDVLGIGVALRLISFSRRLISTLALMSLKILHQNRK